jgi:hypothetical protein
MTTPTHLHTQLQTAVIADLLGPANGPEEIVDEFKFYLEKARHFDDRREEKSP